MYSTETSEERAAPVRPEIPAQGYGIAGAILALMFVVPIAGFAIGGELGRFALAGAQYLPFVPLAILAQIGERQLWARVLGCIYAVALQGVIGILTLALVAAALLPPGNPAALTQPEVLLPLLGMTLILVLLFVLSAAVLLRPVRVFLDRWLPLNPDSFTHTIALWVVLFATFSAYAQLAFLGGEPPLLTAIRNGGLGDGALGDRSALQQNLELVYGLLWLIPLALIGAGWPLKRTFGATLQRLGLVLPTARQVLFALLGAVGLALVVGLVGAGIAEVWRFFGWPRTDSATFEQLLGAFINPAGAVVIGVTAGLGEELAVRGLLQPRLGLVLSNLAFTAVHAYQYGPDNLLVVFTLGTILGIIRARTNTTTSAILHGTYDFLLVLAAYGATQGWFGT